MKKPVNHMPTITNHAGLPDPIVRAVSYNDRNVGDSDYTVTELTMPPRIVSLRRKYADQITEDAADRIWALMGSAAHEVLRRSAPDGQIVERRFFATVDGKRISGQVDYSPEDGRIFDYKFVSAWSVKDGPKPEWVQQLNCYRYLLDNWGNGMVLGLSGSLEIIAILRDWSKMEAARDPNYPQQGVLVLPVPVWPLADTEAWIRQRIEAHEAANVILPECTPDEVWEKPEKWAVKKRGNVRASRLCDSEQEALTYAVTKFKSGEWAIEYRRAERPRCEHYCAVSEFCGQYHAWKESTMEVAP